MRYIVTTFFLIGLFLFAACKDNTAGATYTITYYAEEATGGTVPEKQTKAYGVDIELAENPGNLYRDGYALVGWNTSRSANGTLYQLGAVYSGNADLSLYAVWTTGYSVSFNENGADFGDIPSTRIKIGGTDLSLPGNTGNLQKTGFGFAGWNTDPSGSGTKYSSGSLYTTDQDITLYAMWYDVSWAESASTGIIDTEFRGTAVDAAGNVWAAGFQKGNISYSYSGVNVSGPYDMGENAVIVKYNPDGTGEWAKSVETEAPVNITVFNAVAVDSSGNSYAAGYVTGAGDFNFGNGQTITTTNVNKSSVLVKYDGGGTPQWVIFADGPSDSEFLSVAIQGTAMYAAGYQTTAGSFDYGGTAIIGAAAAENAVLLRFDGGGTPLWAITTQNGSGDYATRFEDIALDSSGNIYAAGYKFGGVGAVSDFTNGITTEGAFNSNNAVVVKYDPASIPQWAVVPSSGGEVSWFNSITVDGSNGIYAAGYQTGTTIFDYGGSSVQGQYAGGKNAILVKFDTSGAGLWAKAPESGSEETVFYGATTDGESIWTAGYQNSTITYTYSAGVDITGIDSGYNQSLVKYDANGKAVWAKTALSSSGQALYYDLAASSSNIIASGYQSSTGNFIYGTDEYGLEASTAGNGSGVNSVIVKYVK